MARPAPLPATCAVFCGGRSTRMGADKAFLDWKGKPLALHVADRLRSHFEKLVISGDPAKYAKLGLPCVPDMGGQGPLAGLYSVLFAAETPAVFAIACDMPFVEPAAVRLLWDRLRGHDVAVPVTAEGPEPLHAWYAKRALAAVGRALAGKMRMAGFWGEIDLRRVDAGEIREGARGLLDCDTAREYEGMAAGLCAPLPAAPFPD